MPMQSTGIVPSRPATACETPRSCWMRGSSGPAPTTRLTSDVVHNLSLAQSLGAVPSSQQITVGVALKNPNEAAENTYLASLYDPSSANYQQFLDPDAFNLKFGVSDADYQAAQN